MLKQLSGKPSAFDYERRHTWSGRTNGEMGEIAFVDAWVIRIFIYSSLSAPSPTLIARIDFNKLARPCHRERTVIHYLRDLSLHLTSRLIEKMT